MDKDIDEYGCFNFRLEPQFTYFPQKDIKVEELAEIIIHLIKPDGFKIEKLKPQLLRHFRRLD